MGQVWDVTSLIPWQFLPKPFQPEIHMTVSQLSKSETMMWHTATEAKTCNCFKVDVNFGKKTINMVSCSLMGNLRVRSSMRSITTLELTNDGSWCFGGKWWYNRILHSQTHWAKTVKMLGKASHLIYFPNSFNNFININHQSSEIIYLILSCCSKYTGAK